MKDITRNKRFSPTEITGTIEFNYGVDRVASVLSNMEDFEAVAPDKFLFINDDGIDYAALRANQGVLKDYYKKVIVTLVPQGEDQCLLHSIFYRKKMGLFFSLFLFSSMFIVSWGCLFLIRGDINEAMMTFNLKALTLPLLAFLWPIAFYLVFYFGQPLKEQIKVIEKVFVDELQNQIWSFNRHLRLDKLIETEREVK